MISGINIERADPHFANLSVECHSVLRIAAAVGVTFALHEVAEMLQRPVAALLPMIDEALVGGVILADGNDFTFCDNSGWRRILATIPEPALHSLRLSIERPSTLDGWETLSDRERTIARLVGDGLTNQQVSKLVFLSPHTVNYHLRRIFRKLNLRSRVELARHLPPADPTR